MECNTAVKRNDLLIHATIEKNLKIIMLSKKVSLKKVYTVLSHLYKLLENVN